MERKLNSVSDILTALDELTPEQPKKEKETDYYRLNGEIRQARSELSKLMVGPNGYLCKLYDLIEAIKSEIPTSSEEDPLEHIAADFEQLHGQLKDALSDLQDYCIERY